MISNAPLDSANATNEIFGPIASIYEVDSDEKAIRAANDTPSSLVSYVYTRDVAKAIAAADDLESGMIGINRPVVADPAAPFGGIKASGLGKEGGTTGIEEYQIEKYIALTV